MFDELNALGGTQSGVSASHYDQCSKYQILRPQGNGVNFSTAYIEAMRGKSRAKELALAAAANDPWGPAGNPDPPRTPSEKRDSEDPFYFSTNAAADMLNLKDRLTKLAILWSGHPKFPQDTVEINQLILQVLAFGFRKENIFVLYRTGKLRPGHLIQKTVEEKLPVQWTDENGRIRKDRQLRAATKKQLKAVLQHVNPQLVFFFANDHGTNSNHNNGAPTPREGADAFPEDDPFPPTPPPTDFGSGDGDLDSIS